MKNLIKAGRAFYGIGIAGIGIQQFIYADFRPVILPLWPSWILWLPVWAYITGAAMIVAGVIFIVSKNAKRTALFAGAIFLFFFIAFHVSYQLFFNPYQFHLGSWTNALKELAFSGGAFIIAGSFTKKIVYANSVTRFLEKLIPWGIIFFSLMLIVFGIDHFIYTDYVAPLVPAWIPWHVFWVYFAGTALAGSGLFLLLKIKVKIVGLLLGAMLFIWFLILHIPRAVVAPVTDKGNELTSVFEALVFSGIAFVIACMGAARRRFDQI